MLTLAEMTVLPSAELRSLALHANCFFYGKALSQVAAALDALALGDRKTAQAHVERAKTARLRASEVEADRVKRCMRDIEARGSSTVETGTHRGIGAHVSMMESHRSDGSHRSLGTTASVAR